MAWRWLPQYPTSDNRMYEIPDIMQDNFEGIEAILDIEHETLSSTGASGIHRPGLVSTIFVGTSAEILALTDMEEGALAFSTDGGALYKYISSAWTIMTDTHSRSRAYLNASTSATTGISQTASGDWVIFDTASYDNLSEYNTSTGVFTAVGSGDYLVVTSVAVCAARAIPVYSIVATGAADVTTTWVTSGSANHYVNIREYPTPDDSTSYNIESTSGDKDFFTHSEAGDSPAPVGATGYYLTVTFRARGYGCSCNLTCYGYSSCTCDTLCYGESCQCEASCYGFGCTCQSTCYGYTPCYCNYTTYGYSCTCDFVCFLYSKTCTCNAACDGYACTCNGGCYGYVACSCNGVCYGYSACTCDSSCVVETGCICDVACYEEEIECTCDTQCYDEGAARVVPLIRDASGNVYYGDEQALNTAWTTYTEAWTISPSTGLEWTRDEINTFSRFGIELRNDGGITTGCSGAVTQEYVTFGWYPTLPVYVLRIYKNDIEFAKVFQPIIDAGVESDQTIMINTMTRLDPGDTIRVALVVVRDTAEQIIGSADGAYTYLVVHRIEGQCV